MHQKQFSQKFNNRVLVWNMQTRYKELANVKKKHTKNVQSQTNTANYFDISLFLYWKLSSNY